MAKQLHSPIFQLGIAAVILFVTSASLSRVQALAGQSATGSGDLDASFGVGGKVVTNFFASEAEAHYVAIQPEGKILVSGWAADPPNQITKGFALARFNRDGSLDTTFGNGGKLGYNAFGGRAGPAGAIAVQQDGKILVAGGVSGLSRLNADGSLDRSFGDGGGIVDPFVVQVLIQADGKIVTTQSALIGTVFGFGLARYNPDGSLDSSFGSAGKISTEFVHNLISQPAAAVLQTDGKIVVAGDAQLPDAGSGVGHAFALGRYNPDGALDAGFGVGGKVITQVLDGSFALAVSVGPDGKILAVGLADNTATRARMVAAARYDPDGSLDPTFGVGGKATREFFGPGAVLHAVAIRSDGKFVAAGSVPVGGIKETGFGIAYFKSDGTPDTTFGVGGKVTTTFPGDEYDDGLAVAFQPDGQIVAAGSSDGEDNFALARYNTELDFSLQFETASLQVERGTKSAARLDINRSGGFNGNVTISPADTSALHIRVIPVSVTTSEATANFRIKVKANAATGSQPIVFTATDASGRARSAILTVVVE